MPVPLTILGGGGFVGGHYVAQYYDPAVANIASVNARNDYDVYSPDVLYFISTVHNYNVFEQSLLDIETNLVTLMRVLENWRHKDAQGVFNFISSWFVYGDQEDPYNVGEDAYCEPRGFYSITKRCAEQLLMSYCQTYGLHYRILRLANIVGPGDKKVSAKKNALQFLINKLAKDEDIELYNGGQFYRDYMHVEDCVRAIELCITKGELDTIYNVGNGGKLWTFCDIMAYCARKLGSDSKITAVPPKAFHAVVQVPTFSMNVDKLRALGFVPEYTAEKLFRSLLP